MCITNLGKVIVRVQWFLGKNPYVSESLKLNDNKSKSLSLEKYKESLRSIMCTKKSTK